MGTLKVDAGDLHSGGSQVAAAAHNAAQEFSQHECELAEAESGWVGESREALAEFAEMVARQHAAAHTAATELSYKLADAAVRYTSTDDDTSEAIARVADAMGL